MSGRRWPQVLTSGDNLLPLDDIRNGKDPARSVSSGQPLSEVILIDGLSLRDVVGVTVAGVDLVTFSPVDRGR
jgi:hypothetical protein